MTVKRKIGAVDVNADRIAAQLIDRLIAAERKIESLQKQVSDNFDAYAETLPHLTNNGQIIFRNVLADFGECGDGKTVTVTPNSTT